jgi:hypothetical protein
MKDNYTTGITFVTHLFSEIQIRPALEINFGSYLGSGNSGWVRIDRLSITFVTQQKMPIL